MRHSPRNLRIACDHTGLTHFGGIYFFREFLRVLQKFALLVGNFVELRTGNPVSTQFFSHSAEVWLTGPPSNVTTAARFRPSRPACLSV